MTEPELRALAARDATDNPFGKMLERIAEAQAERDAARAELDAERERVRVLREALERAQSAIGLVRALNNPCGDQETERDLRRYQAQSYGIATRAYEAAGEALATTEPKP